MYVVDDKGKRHLVLAYEVHDTSVRIRVTLMVFTLRFSSVHDAAMFAEELDLYSSGVRGVMYLGRQQAELTVMQLYR